MYIKNLDVDLILEDLKSYQCLKLFVYFKNIVSAHLFWKMNGCMIEILCLIDMLKIRVSNDNAK